MLLQMMPKNPLDAILAEVLGDDGGLLMAGTWSEEPDDLQEVGQDDPGPEEGRLLIEALAK